MGLDKNENIIYKTGEKTSYGLVDFAQPNYFYYSPIIIRIFYIMEEIFTKRRGFVTKKEEDIVRNILQKHAKEQKGEIIGSEYEIIAYYDNGKNLIAAIIFRNVWNALDIKYLAVVKEYRGKKLGEKLLNEALKIAKDELKCKIAYISTFNYQALEYYKQYGFKLEFTRDGYSNDVKYHYLSKILTPSSI